MSTFDAWANFYVIVGSSAAALTGLQFVVLTLIAQASRLRGQKDSLAAFGSPNVVHFCAALLIASILTAPWHAAHQASVPVAACGLAGVAYCAVVARRALRQSGYQPVLEDWIWHTILPPLAYLAMLAAGITMAWRPGGALFVIAAAELLLVFIGIHNAWDTVMYVTIVGLPEPKAATPPATPATALEVQAATTAAPAEPPTSAGG
jgi:hypothetical protein